MILLALTLQAANLSGGPPNITLQREQPPATILVEPAAMLLAACDGDADALVAEAERDACLARAYATAEGASADKVGYIAYADWAQRWLGDRNALPGPYELDKDGDNRISLAELTARFSAIAARYDVNGDGTLTRSELVTIRSLPPGQGGPGRERGRRR